MAGEYKYEGDELALFQHARNWKKYFSSVIRPLIQGDTLETGAGIGATTPLINDGSARAWLLLEPDPGMCAILENKIAQKELPSNCQVKNGTIQSLTGQFDSIVYIDVLEHIEQDKNELALAAGLLRKGGTLVVLAPAFNHLFSEFDKSIGHHRRYNKKMLKRLNPEGLILDQCRYFDSMGYFAALMNRLFMKQKYPTNSQVTFWDSWLVPVSKFTDRIFMNSFGKSIICSWKKPA